MSWTHTLAATAAADGWWGFLLDQRDELATKTFEHLVYLTVIPVGLAVLIGVPLGVLVRRVAWARRPTLWGASVIQTVPSLALLALLQILFNRIGLGPAIVALTAYALLPIIRNTYTGLDGVPAETIEAARAMGFTPAQRLRLVELPLALPVIVAGVRTAAVIDVGIATLASLIGAGGLGDFIISGLELGRRDLILLGVFAAAALALATDGLIGLIELFLARKRRT